MADGDQRRHEPDVGILVMGIAGAAVSTAALLAVVATSSIGWILLAGLFPVICWALLLREIHRILRFNGGDDPDGEWLQGDTELWGGHVTPPRHQG
ncbi:MAG: hypothetical protein AAGC46_05165 [Solirubrobacteraceae bacterium]|nr:hypothetical protein [Patulibacter sp.]